VCIKFLALIGLLFSSLSFGGEVYDKFPNKINANEKYVFYSHGHTIEGNTSTPIHKRWGIYDFPKVKEALADDGYNLIAYHRLLNTDPIKYAKKLAMNVRALIVAGVKPKNITLLGFSRGGGMSIRASNELRLDQVNLIILAACAGPIKNNNKIKIYGNVFSIYETSDSVGSCQFLKDRSEQVVSFFEMSINTGKGHAAFFTPKVEWIEPVKAWINSKAS
jgi:hypothetical protein